MCKKIDLLEKMYDLINNIINEITNKTNVIYKKMSKATELDMITLYLIKCKLNKIITQSNKDLKYGLANILYEYAIFWGDSYSKNISETIQIK